MSKVRWNSKRISNEVDPETGRRIVKLPTLPGVSASDRDAIFAFEASVLGTFRSVIRMNKRAQGDTPPTVGRLVSAGIPKGIAKYFPTA